MGKKQVRAQMRRVKPKAPAPGQMAQGTTRKQRERYVEAGGMLQGYAPDFVVRLGYIAVGVAVACLIVMGALILVLRLFYGWADAIVAAVAWVLPIALLASFVAPGFRLALKDRRAEAKLVQGQLIGASTVSNSMGLGLLMLQTRGGSEQYLVFRTEALHAALAAVVGTPLGALVNFAWPLLRRGMMARPRRWYRAARRGERSPSSRLAEARTRLLAAAQPSERVRRPWSRQA